MFFLITVKHFGKLCIGEFARDFSFILTKSLLAISAGTLYDDLELINFL